METDHDAESFFQVSRAAVGFGIAFSVVWNAGQLMLSEAWARL